MLKIPLAPLKNPKKRPVDIENCTQFSNKDVGNTHHRCDPPRPQARDFPRGRDGSEMTAVFGWFRQDSGELGCGCGRGSSLAGEAKYNRE